ncbi:MAG: hypothetical protein II625_01650 [Bacilli bacterium]|nr:hypothetical protein [Bacilli bacterium]
METRQSRMDKYFEAEDEAVKPEEVVEEQPVFSSRTQKNQELYKQVSSLDIEGFDLNSNSTVLDVDASEIDIADVKEQLEEKYHENPRNKSFGDTDEINLPKINLDETREYDINAILAKAKEEKEINYEEDRHRKVNDVLKDIEEYTQSIKKNRDDDSSAAGVSKDNEDELRELIDTINAKELIDEEDKLEVTGDMDPLDLLSDLKGDDDNTKVLGQLTEELEIEDVDDDTTEELTTEEIERISEMSKDDEDTIEVEEVDDNTEEIEKEIEDTDAIEEVEEEQEVVEEAEEEEEVKPKKEKKKNEKKNKKLENLDDSFVGQTTTFNQDDFDEFDDLKEDMKATKIIIKILIIIIVLVFIAGLIVLANSKFNWGLF